jgi:hypothetical protein
MCKYSETVLRKMLGATKYEFGKIEELWNLCRRVGTTRFGTYKNFDVIHQCRTEQWEYCILLKSAEACAETWTRIR